jgi:hypothetical protein
MIVKNMKDSELLEQLEKSYEAFMVPLRMGDGLEEKPYNEFCKLLVCCSDIWGEDEVIPKRAALIFVDAFSSMISSSYLYDEAVGAKISMAADEMNDLIRQCIE